MTRLVTRFACDSADTGAARLPVPHSLKLGRVGWGLFPAAAPFFCQFQFRRVRLPSLARPARAALNRKEASPAWRGPNFI